MNMDEGEGSEVSMSFQWDNPLINRDINQDNVIRCRELGFINE